MVHPSSHGLPRVVEQPAVVNQQASFPLAETRLGLAAAPRGLPENNRFLRPSTKGRIARSTALVTGVSSGESG